MNEQRITESPSWSDPRGQVTKTPDDVAEMLRLKACGWGLKRIARQLGCSHHTVKVYMAADGVKPFKSPERPKRLDGLEGWLRERFIRHRGNADVVRQDLLAEKGLAVSRRTLQRAVQPYRQALRASALATTRFETPPGRQLQIDFGERLVEIGGAKIKAFVFVATLGHSRRLHVRAFRAEKQEHWFAGIESAFTTFGGVPEEVDGQSGAVAVDRRARRSDGRGWRGAHPSWHARGCGPQAIAGPPSADRRFQPPRRGCRSQWRCLPSGDCGIGGAGVVASALVVASSCRIRSSDRRGLLMARANKATEAPIDPLDAMLMRLQLFGIRDQLDSLLDEAARANLSMRETLMLLCEREIARKDHRRIEMALKLAHFPAVKELAGFDFEAQPSIDPKQIRDLAASRWIANGENVLLLGPPEAAS